VSEAFVLDAVRLPRGKAKAGGGLNGITPIAMLVQLFHALEERTKLDPATVDDVIIGCASQVGEQGGNIARTAALMAGWGNEVPGVTINRFCASGIDAVAHASARIRAGSDELILAGGVESVSRVPMFSDGAPLWDDPATVAQIGSVHMGIAADLVATLEGFEREELDAYGAETQQRAARAWGSGTFARSVVPAVLGDSVVLDRDEHVRPDVSVEQLRTLAPAFADLPDQDALALARYPELDAIRHLHTRGTSPSLADGACVVLIGSEAAAARIGIEPRARIVATAARSVDPVTMLTAGQLAAEDAIAQGGRRMRSIASSSPKRSPRCACASSAICTSPRSDSIPTEAPSRWGTRSEQPARSWSPISWMSCTRWVRAVGSRPSAGPQGSESPPPLRRFDRLFTSRGDCGTVPASSRFCEIIFGRG